MRHLRERPFFFLLGVLLVSVVVYPVLHETRAARETYDVLRTLVLVGAFRVIFASRREFVPGIGLAAVLIAGVWIEYLFPGRAGRPVALTLHALATGFFALAVASILRAVYRARAVSADGVAGALCAYLLLAVVFAHAFWFVEAVAPGSFKGEGEFAAELGDPVRSQFALHYYSLATLASVGTTDVTPARGAARGLTVLEGICGQFYIAVLIADLVGKRLAGPRPAEPARPAAPAYDDLPTEIGA